MMSDIQDLYQQVILDHGRRPRCFGADPEADIIQSGYNPLCGDRLTLYLRVSDGIVTNIQFDGEGCAISMASASLMAQMLKGKSIKQVEASFEAFSKMVTANDDDLALDEMKAQLGKCAILEGVKEYPSRVKCATLVWHALKAGLAGQNNSPVSTEQEEAPQDD